MLEMGLEIPLVNTLGDDQAFQDLVKLGGKDQVPCLRIETDKGIQWMYESKDIIHYLKSRL